MDFVIFNMHPIIAATAENYNKIAKHFSDTRKKIWAEFEYFKPYFKNGQTILDWGCGDGRLLGYADKSRVHYVGLDISEELIKIAKEKYKKEMKTGRAKFYCTFKKEKNFPPRTFDLVFMVVSFFHLPDEKSRIKLLKKIHKELKNGGRVIILVWNLRSKWAKAKLRKGWKNIGPNDFIIPWKNPKGEVICERYYHHFTKEELGRLFLETGFKVERMDLTPSNWSDDRGGKNLMAVAIKK